MEMNPSTLRHVYGAQNEQAARARCAGVANVFARTFGAPPQALFSAPGRTELGGNHTDHQHGRVLAAAVDLDILAAVTPAAGTMVRLLSEGCPMVEVDLRDLTVHPEEVNTSAALIRGVAAGMDRLGRPVTGGFDAYVISDVPRGSGLSSSAAFEVLVGTILNELYLGGAFSPMELAQIGQYAENVYFGKPCGLMDQTACALGGAVAIDFGGAAPQVEQIPLDLHAHGYALCILDSGAHHGDLTAEYGAITDEMGAVSRYFGKSVLRDVPQADFLAALPELRCTCGDRSVLRALHFYAENDRAAAEAAALRRGDFAGFLSLVRASGRSSAMYLQNICPAGAAKRQELLVTIALCEELLSGRGAVRVHGGGFGGTAQAFVPLDLLADFQERAAALLGPDRCRTVAIRPVGGIRLA